MRLKGRAREQFFALGFELIYSILYWFYRIHARKVNQIDDIKGYLCASLLPDLAQKAGRQAKFARKLIFCDAAQGSY